MLQLIASASVLPTSAWATSSVPPASWNGVAFGGDVTLTVDGFAHEVAQSLIEDARSELDRLERIFSLYNNRSTLSKLNQNGTLHNAPRELTDVLRLSDTLFIKTDGAFDPTVQTYWDEEDNTTVGFNHVSVDRDTIRLVPGTRLTLNGIAQGFITDHIAERFRTAGATHTLINLGEFQATGPKLDGRAWEIGLRDPEAIWRVAETVSLKKGALATSSRALPSSRLSQHIFDPATGLSPTHIKSVSVIAPTATWADGLSTALFIMPLEKGCDLLGTQQNVAARFTMADGEVFTTSDWGRLTS
jgi:thiamine biosynthesis lipoprotein|tara:strand:- start:61 stop:966 length:906 start_codon:yes stop_codon:yes gene_type:complete